MYATRYTLLDQEYEIVITACCAYTLWCIVDNKLSLVYYDETSLVHKQHFLITSCRHQRLEIWRDLFQLYYVLTLQWRAGITWTTVEVAKFPF